MSNNREHAVVIGGSMAGLLAARVLSNHFGRVTIIERDTLPQSGEHRGGVPQSRHLHTLLVQGQHTLEKLFPGFSAEMSSVGAPEVTWGVDNIFLTTGGYAQQYDMGIQNNLLSRVELEWLVRKRVQNIANITFLTERDVRGLIASDDHQTVLGVEIESRQDHQVEQIMADLVVDASGRGSKAPEWLQSLGYGAPQETVINAHTGYATRWFERPANGTNNNWAIVIQPRAAEKLYRGGGLMLMEGNRWVVTLLGANGDYPPTDEAGFMEFAKTLPGADIYNAIKDAKPISPIYGYRKLENRMRHYEKLSRRPDGLIVTGDAACAFNPIYGQGMTAAALEADLLDTLLQKHANAMAGFPAAFQKGLRRVADGPWLMATSEDMRYPDVEGQKPNAVIRLMHRYLDLLARAIPYDRHVALAFVQGMNLLKHPSVMMRPDIVTRVLLRTLQMRRKAAMSTTRPQLATGEISVAKL